MFSRGKKKRKDVAQYAIRVEDHLFQLHRELATGTWRHRGYRRMRVCDPKPRVIHKADIRDRIVHQVVYNAIATTIEHSYCDHSWSCRVRKGTHAAVMQTHKSMQRLNRGGARTLWVLQCDIKQYFRSIDRRILFRILERRVTDCRIRSLVRAIITSFAPGLPLGNLTSQLFANAYLDAADHWMIEQQQPFLYARYTDDILLAHSSKSWLAALVPRAKKYLWESRRLTLHPHKVSLRPFHYGIDFLGHTLFPEDRLLRARSRKRMRRRIAALIERHGSGHVSDATLNATLASYRGMAVHTTRSTDVAHIDALAAVI